MLVAVIVVPLCEKGVERCAHLSLNTLHLLRGCVAHMVPVAECVCRSWVRQKKLFLIFSDKRDQKYHCDQRGIVCVCAYLSVFWSLIFFNIIREIADRVAML